MFFFLLLLRCDKSDCNGLLRPNMVFFGETMDSHILTKVEKEMEVCDLCLVVSYCVNTNVCHGILTCFSFLNQTFFFRSFHWFFAKLQVGTSSIVYPAAMFGPLIASRGVPVAEFNTKTTPKTEYFT